MRNNMSTRLTSYGIKKAVGIEAVRRLLDECELGWISAVSDCQIDTQNHENEMRCIFGFITSKGISYIGSVTLVTRQTNGAFPIDSVVASVFERDYPDDELAKTIIRSYEITDDGEFVSR